MILATNRSELERWLASAAFNAFYRFRLREIGLGECKIEVPFREEFERPGGAISGPVFMSAADVAIWFAVATHRGLSESWVTAEDSAPRSSVQGERIVPSPSRDSHERVIFKDRPASARLAYRSLERVDCHERSSKKYTATGQ